MISIIEIAATQLPTFGGAILHLSVLGLFIYLICVFLFNGGSIELRMIVSTSDETVRGSSLI